MFSGIVIFAFGVASYATFLISFLYAIGFVGNMFVPKTIDSGAAGPFGESLLINAGLLGLFAVQHSVMARQGFKKWWTKIVPTAAERSVYVLLSSVLLLLLFWQWRPLPTVIWSVENEGGALIPQSLFWIGWTIVLLSTFMINHFDLFGLRQVYLRLRGWEYTNVKFQVSWLYKLVRHPIMLGFLIAFWATPQMTLGHLVFTIATTGYVLVGIWFEEKDLARAHPQEYEKYRSQAPMLVPFSKKSGS